MKRALGVSGVVVAWAFVVAACADSTTGADPVPSDPTTTSVPIPTSSTTTTTTLAEPAGCAASVPDDAAHISANRTPLDVDRDGVADEILVSETDDGHRIHVRLADGSLWVDVPGTDWPRLLDRPGGGAAARDLDGDGLLEFFLPPTSTNGAELVRLGECGGTVHEIGPHEGEWCLRDGELRCDRRIACVGPDLISDMTSGGDVEGLDADEWRWGRTLIRLDGDELVVAPITSVEYELANPPPGVPTAADAGTVDCSPDEDAEVPAIDAGPECTATGDRPADATLVAEVDLDGDGTLDRIVSWEAGSGAPEGWLHIELAGGATESIAIPYNWGGGPELMAAADVDGDGVLEVFLTAPSNTARNAFAVQLTGCTVDVIDYADEPASDPWSQGLLLHGIGGGSCAPTGCVARVTCTTTGVVVEQTGPNDNRNEQFDPDDPEMYWWRTVYALRDGAWHIVDETTTIYRHADPPADSPQVLGEGLHC
ncbi:MAG: VCBS repeat-containing protein [Acidimicrobiales bacterium]|nr:VCBS repeat-containing protein [Acidimicrobiales bacterium]